MATASVTNSFIADTTAIAGQVNQNFTDIITFLNNSVLHSDGSRPMTAELNLAGFKVLGVGTPALGTDAANKTYVDTAISNALSAEGGTPPGAMMQYAGSTAPTGWLLCNGQAVSRTLYSALFAVCGTAYGAGDGVTTFNVPNLTGRFPVGRDASVAQVDVLGETGGSRDAIVVQHNHTFSGSTSVDGSHTHTSNDLPLASTNTVASGTAKRERTSVSGVSSWFIAGGAHSHGVSGTIANNGSSGTGANMPPFVVVNYIIYTGA